MTSSDRPKPGRTDRARWRERAQVPVASEPGHARGRLLPRRLRAHAATSLRAVRAWWCSGVWWSSPASLPPATWPARRRPAGIHCAAGPTAEQVLAERFARGDIDEHK